MAIRVGISYGPPRGNYPHYNRALGAAGARLGLEVETIDLEAKPEEFDSVDGLVLTGGPDVDPARFGMAEFAPLCKVDAARDEHEFALLARAESARLPIFAICRGAQLLNVAHGGTLVPDLADETAIRHGASSDQDRRHEVSVESTAMLARLAGSERGEVNSHHHQAVDRLAAGFVVTARSDDGTIEAFEWTDPGSKPYLLAVQWHPERMDDAELFAGPLFDRFLAAARAFSEIKV